MRRLNLLQREWKKPTWTEAHQQDLILQWESGVSTADIARSFGLAASTLRTRLNKLFADGTLKRRDTCFHRPTRWPKEDVAKAKQLHENGHTDAEIAKALGKSISTTRRRLREMGLIAQGSAPWPNEEVATLKALHAEGFTNAEIAFKMGKTADAVRGVLRRIGLTSHESRSWTEEEKNQLWELRSKGMTYAELADRINKSRKAIRAALRRMEEQRKQALSPPSRQPEEDIDCTWLKTELSKDPIRNKQWENYIREHQCRRLAPLRTIEEITGRGAVVHCR